eukprot:SAG11_NODE_887_length_6694_cov_21.780440_1_plen_84_part_00
MLCLLVFGDINIGRCRSPGVFRFISLIFPVLTPKPLNCLLCQFHVNPWLQFFLNRMYLVLSDLTTRTNHYMEIFAVKFRVFVA